MTSEMSVTDPVQAVLDLLGSQQIVLSIEAEGSLHDLERVDFSSLKSKLASPIWLERLLATYYLIPQSGNAEVKNFLLRQLQRETHPVVRGEIEKIAGMLGVTSRKENMTSSDPGALNE